MDERRFDAMARVLGMGSVSRRSFGGLLLAGSALVAARADEAQAKRKGNGNGKGNGNNGGGKGNNGKGNGNGKGNDKKAKNDARCPAGKPFVSDNACFESEDDVEFFCRTDPRQPCVCVQTSSNVRACAVAVDQDCPEVDQCDRDKDCGPGQICARVGGCCNGNRANLCLPKCPPG